MSLKIESPRPQPLSRPAVSSQVSPAAAKASPAPSAAPRPSSDGFERAAPSAAAQASIRARLEGFGTQQAQKLGASAPDSTGEETYAHGIDFGDEITDSPEQTVAMQPMTNGTTRPKDEITGELRLTLDGMAKTADISNLQTAHDVYKLAHELGRSVERPEGVSQNAVDDYLAQQLFERLASQGLDLGKSPAGKTSP